MANVKYLYIACVTGRSNMKPENILEEAHLRGSKVSQTGGRVIVCAAILNTCKYALAPHNSDYLSLFFQKCGAQGEGLVPERHPNWTLPPGQASVEG